MQMPQLISTNIQNVCPIGSCRIFCTTLPLPCITFGTIFYYFGSVLKLVCIRFCSLNPSSGPIQSLSGDVRELLVFVCLSVPSRKSRFPVEWILVVEERIANILNFCCFDEFLRLNFSFYFFGSMQTSLLFIMGEFSLGGSVAIK